MSDDNVTPIGKNNFDKMHRRLDQEIIEDEVEGIGFNIEELSNAITVYCSKHDEWDCEIFEEMQTILNCISYLQEKLDALMDLKKQADPNWGTYESE